ncbi:MAG TPA: glycyl-radical enzyme activating protein [Bacteroidales bacterium]|nr:glycyl-radical enzyme activating protein [Bacteroidales bacterium]
MAKTNEMEGTIFKVRRFSIHDGPGIRTTVFLKGCPLNCIWCHSPEGISSSVTIWHNDAGCISCGTCVEACPENVLSLSGRLKEKILINRTSCKLTGKCIEVCPSEALQYTGKKVTVAELMSEILRDIIYYNESGGGVTLSGGEPLFQPDFSYSLLEACINMGINTAVETSLFCDREILDRFAGVTGVFMTDIKIYDNEEHMKYTGVSNEIILENFRYLLSMGKKVIVRIPLIPGITDTPENLNSIFSFVNSLKKSTAIEMIQYNTLAPNNYRRLGLQYPVEQLSGIK